jgi:hypothetical protein
MGRSMGRSAGRSAGRITGNFMNEGEQPSVVDEGDEGEGGAR